MNLSPYHKTPGKRNTAACPFAMNASPRSWLAGVLSLACVLSLGIDLPATATASAIPADKSKKPKVDPVLKGLPVSELTADEAVLHALNRLAYGPRPGDVERVKQMGLAKWIDQQLNPNSIDDRALQARLENYPTLAMSTTRLMEDYPQPKQAAKEAAKVQAQTAQQTRAAAAAEIVAKDAQATATTPFYTPQNFPNSASPAPSTKANAGTAAGNPASATPSPATAAPTAAQTKSNPAAPSPMKEDPALTADSSNVATRGAGGKRDVLGGADPNAVPKAIADDSKRPHHLQRAPIATGAGRFLVQSFQRIRRQRRGPLLPHLLRTRCHPAAHAGEI
jgi:hypothetical protein